MIERLRYWATLAKWSLTRPPPAFVGDGMTLWSRDPAFLSDQRFMAAYREGMNSGHRIGNGRDLHLEWRVHIAHWAARQALSVEGDFVECGVNTGILSLAICRLLDFGKIDRRFWLFDTYDGIPEETVAESERHSKTLNAYYFDCYDLTKRNFAPYPNAHLVRGIVPQSLGTVQIDTVAYLSIDMNNAAPERAAMEHFWPKLSVGGVVVLDDYGFQGHSEQRNTINEFAKRENVPVAMLPTGQGLMVKPRYSYASPACR